MNLFVQRFILVLCVILLGVGCNKMASTETSPPVVVVDGQVLTLKELRKAIPKNLNKNDSLAFTQNYISRWVKAALMLRKAELNLSPEEKDVEQLLQNYRSSLLINKYQQKLILEKYSPLITINEIEAYYNDMKENFRLNEDVVQGVFVQVPLNTPNLRQLKRWYRSDNPDDFVLLEDYCYQNAQKFEVFQDKWIPVEQISKLMPNPIPDNPNYLKYNKYYETKDTMSHYMVSFKAFHIADEIAPLGYVEDKIKAILLNKKRIEFIQNLEEELYQEGLKQKVIKFY